MKCEWSYTKIKDILSLVVDNRGKTPPTQEVGYPLIEVNAVSECNKFPQYQAVRKCVSQETYNTKFRNGHPKVGDILVPTVGTLGAVSYVNKENCCIAQNIVALRTNNSICDSNFLYYTLRNPITRKRLLNLDIGGVQPSIKVPHLLELEVLLPPLLKQQKIATILSSFDDKIELNNKINENLEQQAQAIFQEWFTNRSEPDWQHGHLSDLVIVRYGKDHKKLADGVFPVFGSGGLMRRVERPLYDKESVLIPRKGTLNNVMYISEPFWSVDTMFYTEMKLPNVAKFVYHFLKSKDLASMNTGSAVPSMTTDILNALELTIPSNRVLAAFENAVSPMYSAMQHNAHESTKLGELRDNLLPKLMNGEVDVNGI